MTPHTVYRLFSGDELVYVGITATASRRLGEHRRQREWWGQITGATFEHFATATMAAAEERRLIRELRPRLNERGKPAQIPDGMKSPAEIAGWLRLHPQTVRSYARRGLLPVAGHTSRRQPYFDQDEVEKWVVAGKAATPLLGTKTAIGAETGSKSGSSAPATPLGQAR